MNPLVESFYDLATSTFSHVVYDRDGGHAAIVDPVMDYDPATARTSFDSAQRLLDLVGQHRLAVDWILETHAHADHLTAAAWLRERTGAKVAIGRGITGVQERFKAVFNLEDEFAADGRQFDRLFDEGDTFAIGDLPGRVVATPGHTGDSLTYVVGNAAFVGDTVFAPDTGTARADFPGGDAATLYRSIRRLFELPDDTRVFLCHDYPPDGREARAETTIAAQRERNVHLAGNVGEDAYVRMRNERDAGLAAPKLILPALQVNIRGGELPPPEANGVRYLRLPVNRFGGGS
ncbi:MBL fold metallo-hydrolase [Luteimonas sp. MC1825]|uniref:MBL fold metallo-hydrolase n=1 Tax=Luteimonas sp. MC1825 TaxID=2761107 RepID=UPI001617D413|nr:MBL fold metallo-hydrolase [Luteimonas sp. MC1825]MBB6598792.1 MBL fold metallo-hydrolase [Luteimonas sp. MC1825]QOC88948.1 MBL fold metallo-hydrolase [Luteimonas sp. MC1825]